MTSASYIFLAGASRGVGREIAQYLIAQQLKVKALLRTANPYKKSPSPARQK
jgi:short-subunit dehydrogenase